MAGFVYYTDARKKSDAIIKQIIPKESHDPIVYESATIAATQYKDACKKFMDYLKGNHVHAILMKFGFGFNSK
jgi:ABC-type molybdate transport system substrate-binding protein